MWPLLVNIVVRVKFLVEEVNSFMEQRRFYYILGELISSGHISLFSPPLDRFPPRRFRLRGARHLIFYSLPEYAHFYPEIVNFLGTKNANEEASENQITSCIVLCTRYEKMALERIVGTKRCEHMLSSGKTTFMFL